MQKQQCLKLDKKNKIVISVTRLKMHWIDMVVIIVLAGLIWAKIMNWIIGIVVILFFILFAFQKHTTEVETK